jgi:hypothetical protein
MGLASRSLNWQVFREQRPSKAQGRCTNYDKAAMPLPDMRDIYLSWEDSGSH